MPATEGGRHPPVDVAFPQTERLQLVVIDPQVVEHGAVVRRIGRAQPFHAVGNHPPAAAYPLGGVSGDATRGGMQPVDAVDERQISA